MSGKYGDSKKEFLERIVKNPRDTFAHWQLGLIYSFEGDVELSLKHLKYAVELDPAQVNVRYDLAMMLTMLGYHDEGCAHLREVLRLQPDHEKAKLQITFCG